MSAASELLSGRKNVEVTKKPFIIRKLNDINFKKLVLFQLDNLKMRSLYGNPLDN